MSTTLIKDSEKWFKENGLTRNSSYSIQEKILAILKENISDPLTLREIQKIVGLSDHSVVRYHIKQLEKKGFIRINPANRKDYTIISEGEKKVVLLDVFNLPVKLVNKNTLLPDKTNETISIDSRLIGFDSKEAFLLRFKGKSMQPKFYENDLLIVQKQTVMKQSDSGSIIVCNFCRVAMVAQLFISENPLFSTGLILFFENRDYYRPLVIDKDHFQMIGVVKGFISYNLKKTFLETNNWYFQR